MKVKLLIISILLCITSQLYAQKNDFEKNNLVYSTMRSIENKGQWRDNVLFKSSLRGGDMFLEANGFAYTFIDENDGNKIHEYHHHKEKANPNEILHYHTLKVNFINANKACKVNGINSFETNYNYYKGNNPEKWGTGAKAFRGVEYLDIYKGIDLYLYEKNGDLKYDFIVSPNSNPNQIIIDYNGEDDIYLEKGNLHIKTSVNEIIEKQPKAFQLIDGEYKSVQCNFILDENENIIFDFPKGYEKSLPLIIDPVLVFSTMTGSLGDNWGHTATYDENGNAYSGGIAYATNGSHSGYPVTVGAFQSSYAGGTSDVALCKYSPDGTSLLYATYIGGSGDDNPMSMIVNNNNELVILGNTNSSNFPISGAYDNTLNNGGVINHDLFITILSSNGSSLLGSTYIGGVNDDGFNQLTYFYSDEHRSEVIVDELDNIYVASNTSSSDFPVTSGSFDNSYNGAQDGCIFKMNSNASSLIWSGFLGGNKIDNTSGIVLDSSNNVYVCGGTEGNGFPITPGTINQTFKGSLNIKGVSPGTLSTDGFITKISSNGASILASTYIQSTNNVFDLAYLIGIDTNEDIYVLGNTEGTYPITNGKFNNDSSSQFIHKLNSNLDSTYFSSTFGSGSLDDILSPTAFLIDDCNRIYVSGWGGFISFSYTIDNNIQGYPVSQNAFKPTTTGEDFYLAVFNENMISLEYATFFGGDISGEHVDGGTSRFSPDGIVYQSVCAGCGGNQDFPTTAGVVSEYNFSTNCNNALFKMEFPESVVKAQINETNDNEKIFCIPDLTKLQNLSKNGKEFTWDFGDGNTLLTYSDTTINHVYTDTGTYQAKLIVYNGGVCFSKPYDTAYYKITVYNSPIADAGNDTVIESCYELELNGCCGPFYSWSPNSEISDAEIQNPITTTNVELDYFLTITDSNGCTAIDSVNIRVEDIEPTIPNVFTPNRDDYNDFFIIDSNCDYDLTLFNRWGKEVYREEKYQNNFDGLDLNDGVYYYVINNELEVYKGWVQILR